MSAFLKKTVFFFLFIIVTAASAQSQSKPVSLKLYSCETGLIYSIDSNEIALTGTWFVPNDSTNLFMRTKLDSAGLAVYSNAVNGFMNIPGDEILYNNCVDDGFNFKIYLYEDSLVKKIFVGNYYDERVDKLTALFDLYVAENVAGNDHYHIGYGDAGNIENIIKDQQACTETTPKKYLDYLLNKWCEMKN